MQVLGQYVEVNDLIVFPVHRRKGETVEAPVVSIRGLTARDAAGNTRVLPYDDHVTVITNPRKG